MFCYRLHVDNNRSASGMPKHSVGLTLSYSFLG